MEGYTIKDVINYVKSHHRSSDQNEKDFIEQVLSTLENKPTIVVFGNHPKFFPSSQQINFNIVNVWWGCVDGPLTIWINSQKREYEVPKPPAKQYKAHKFLNGYWIVK